MEPFSLPASARIKRGMMRIGIVIAALIFVAGIIFLVGSVGDKAERQIAQHDAMNCLRKYWNFNVLHGREYSPNIVDEDRAPCGGSHWISFDELRSHQVTAAPSYWSLVQADLSQGLLFFGAASAAAFVAIWSIGWMISGFMRD